MRLFAIAIISIALFTQCNSKQEVAQWRGPNRDGIYPEKNLLTQWPEDGPKLLWRFDELGLGYSTVAVTSKQVYAIGTIDSISYIFSFTTNGDLLWKKPLGKDWTKNWPGIRSTPVIYGDLGYISNGFGVVFCFDADNGNIKWSKDIIKDFGAGYLTFGMCENLLIDGDKLFCTPAGKEADVVALNRKTGEIIWKTQGSNDSTAYTSPILVTIGDKKYYITQTSKKFISVNSETGEVAWTYKLKGNPLPNTLMFNNGYLYTVDAWKAGSFMLKIADDGASVNEVWRTFDLDHQQGDMVLLNDRLYGSGNSGRKFGCYDWKTGQEIYSDSINVDVVNVISAENLIYYYDLRGNVKLLKPTEKGFEKLGFFKIKGGTPQLHCSHPVIKDGKLYIRHDNSLFVYDIAKK